MWNVIVGMIWPLFSLPYFDLDKSWIHWREATYPYMSLHGTSVDWNLDTVINANALCLTTDRYYNSVTIIDSIWVAFFSFSKSASK